MGPRDSEVIPAMQPPSDDPLELHTPSNMHITNQATLLLLHITSLCAIGARFVLDVKVGVRVAACWIFVQECIVPDRDEVVLVRHGIFCPLNHADKLLVRGVDKLGGL
jgi:hypothetical protein